MSLDDRSSMGDRQRSSATGASSAARPFPFSAVVGQEDAQLALLLAAVDPAIGGVLLRGDKGSAKTTLARGLAALLARSDDHDAEAGDITPDGDGHGAVAGAASIGTTPFVELPVGATEDRVLGSLDVNLLVNSNGDGDPAAAFRPGLLAAAHGGVLYVDEVNLLPDHLVDGLLDAAASGINRVERDGVSHEHPARFVLLGSMNPEEGELRPQLLDRFGLAVEVRAPADPALRAEAVRRRLAHDTGQPSEDGDADAELWRRLATAQPAELSDEVIAMAARLAVEVGAESLRADLVLCRAAAALAGWEGRAVATEDDIARVAPLALGHRRRRRPFDPPTLPPEQLDTALQAAGYDPQQRAGTERPASTGDDTQGASTDARGGHGDRPRDGATDDLRSDGEDHSGTTPSTTATGPFGSGARDADGVGRDIGGDPATNERGTGGVGSRGRGQDQLGVGGDTAARSSTTGRRWEELTPDTEDVHPGLGAIGLLAGREAPSTRSTSPIRPGPDNGGGNGGRVVGYHAPGPDGPRGVAVVPTVRAVVERRAADPEGPRLHPDDLREPRRLPREHRTVIIAVDTSGSMGTEARVRAASGAVLGLLADAYLSRDQVALVAFRGDEAGEVLPPTASVELARARLADLPTGGSTPLAEGISAGLATARRAAAKQASPLLVLLTDGRATGHPHALEHARAAARAVADTGVETLVLDAEDGDHRSRLGLSAELAELMNARYLHLSAIDAGTVEAAVRATLH